MLALESHHTPKFDRTTALAQASEGTMHGFFPTVEPSPASGAERWTRPTRRSTRPRSSRSWPAGSVPVTCDGARALFHPDLRIEQPASLPHGGSHHGLDGMAAMGAAFAEHWERTITDPRILGCGPTVVQVTTQTWTAKATGRSATVDVVELFALTDGRISEIRVFQQDTAPAPVDPGLSAVRESLRRGSTRR